MYDDWSIGDVGLVHTLGIVCKVCVAMFVFLSGYALGITNTIVTTQDIKDFYIRRFTKLFLNYWFIWILFVPIGIWLFRRSFSNVYPEPTFVYTLLDFLGLINLTGEYGYNPTWWFYSCIILLYLVFPLIALTIRKWPWSIWVIVIGSIILIKIPSVFINPVRFYLFPFLFGIILANGIITKKIPPSIFYSLASCFSGTLKIFGLIVILLLFITAVLIRLTISYALLWDSCVALIIVLLYKNINWNYRLHDGMEFLGRHSFNIFLFHTFIYYLYFPFLIYWSRNPLIIFLSLLLSSIVISIGIEQMKKYIGFNNIQYFIQNKYNSK